MARPRVYISGPLSTGGGNRESNVRVAVAAFEQLSRLGFAPLCPHLSHYAEEVHNVRFSHAEWIELDLEWVEASEAVYRLRGASDGADQECGHAINCGIPVLYSVTSLEEWRDEEWCRRPREQRIVTKGDSRFRRELEELIELHDAKQADYGTDGDPFANLRASAGFGIAPWLGAVVRLNDKVNRIKSFVRNGKLRNESLVDSLRDISVYAAIAKILYEEEHGGT
jgi:hypothetical protein